MAQKDVTPVTEVKKSDVVWNQVRDMSIEMFGIPQQTFGQYCKRVMEADPEVVYLLLKASAVLPTLEENIGRVKLPKNETIEIGQAAQYTTLKVVKKEF